MKNNKIVGITFGSFDLCHYGHVLMFEECKEYCDYLIVGVQSDPSIDRSEKNKPIQSHEERIIHINYDFDTDELKRIYEELSSDPVNITSWPWNDPTRNGVVKPVVGIILKWNKCTEENVLGLMNILKN